jgi:hypothetical protein
LEVSVPNACQKNTVLQGFDPVVPTPSEFVAFCERRKFTEGKKRGKAQHQIKERFNNGQSCAIPLRRSQTKTTKEAKVKNGVIYIIRIHL